MVSEAAETKRRPDDPLCCPHCQRPFFDRLEEVRGYQFWRSHFVTPDGKLIHLSTSSLKVFKWLLAAKGRVLPRETLFDLLYGGRPDGGPECRIIDVYMNRIRSMIRTTNLPFYIKTLYMDGYVLKDKIPESKES